MGKNTFMNACALHQRVQIVCEHPRGIRRTSLTQHSRPRTLDRLFSPILVEVLKSKQKQRQSETVDMRETQGGDFA